MRNSSDVKKNTRYMFNCEVGMKNRNYSDNFASTGNWRFDGNLKICY